MSNMKTCPICESRSIKSTATCYECFYRFSNVSTGETKVKSEPREDKMQDFEVVVTERLTRTVKVKASSESEAMTKTKDMHRHSAIILGADDYSYATFSIKK